MIIRIAQKEDVEQLLAIYTPYVLNTAITFEYDVPSICEFENRIVNTLERFPYLVAEKDNEIVGYAYASSFKGRRAYDWSIETSIYVRLDQKGKGIGKKLYLALEAILKQMNIHNVNACIAYTEKEDEHLNASSVAFHEHLGYTMVGVFHKCAYKFNTWYDMCWMEKSILEHTTPDPVIPFKEIRNKIRL